MCSFAPHICMISFPLIWFNLIWFDFPLFDLLIYSIFFIFFISFSIEHYSASCLPVANLVAGIAGLPVSSSVSVFACSNGFHGMSWVGTHWPIYPTLPRRVSLTSRNRWTLVWSSMVWSTGTVVSPASYPSGSRRPIPACRFWTSFRSLFGVGRRMLSFSAALVLGAWC